MTNHRTAALLSWLLIFLESRTGSNSLDQFRTNESYSCTMRRNLSLTSSTSSAEVSSLQPSSSAALPVFPFLSRAGALVALVSVLRCSRRFASLSPAQPAQTPPNCSLCTEERL
eukprot:2434267-Pleurochrysis_carterae.AAC.1